MCAPEHADGDGDEVDVSDDVEDHGGDDVGFGQGWLAEIW